MPPKDEILISRTKARVTASDGSVTREYTCTDEPTARRLEIRLKNDRRFAMHWLNLSKAIGPDGPKWA